MNIEDYRDFCLSIGTDVEEKLPFQKSTSQWLLVTLWWFQGVGSDNHMRIRI